ncbi:hypothetical protein ACM9HF_04580 [Colwellia sp. RE-S-Sl-9]
MLRKGLKYLFILIGIGAVLYALFVYLVVIGLQKEEEQERVAIIELLNNTKVITEVTGNISEVERVISGQYDESIEERESISFSGDLGSAVIEGSRVSNGEVVFINGSITLKGESFPMEFKYPEGTTEFNFDWDFEFSF